MNRPSPIPYPTRLSESPRVIWAAALRREARRRVFPNLRYFERWFRTLDRAGVMRVRE